METATSLSFILRRPSLRTFMHFFIYHLLILQNVYSVEMVKTEKAIILQNPVERMRPLEICKANQPTTAKPFLFLKF